MKCLAKYEKKQGLKLRVAGLLSTEVWTKNAMFIHCKIEQKFYTDLMTRG